MEREVNILRNVIVCGGTGFIGKWLINELLLRNIHVIELVRDKGRIPSAHMRNDNFSYIETEYINLSNLNIEDDIDCFYYLAWAGVSGKEKNEFLIQLDNIKFAVEAIKLAKKVSAKKFIATGTVAEYVFSENLIDVSAKQTPNDLYGATKTAVHYYLDVLSRQSKQPFIWALLPSTYGEGRTDSNIITYTIVSLLNKKKTKYGNLNQMWDFLYVADVAKALYYLGIEGSPNKVYGIGSGVYKPLKEYLYIIRDIIDPEAVLGIGELPEMSSKTFSSCVDISEIIKDTHFVPQTSFEEGIAKTILYYRSI